jgi:hypothetical protein
MQEKLVEFETAELAQKKGFFYMKANCYGDNMCYKLPEKELINSLRGGNNYIHAPTQSLLQKWLREEHQIIVTVLPNYQADIFEDLLSDKFFFVIHLKNVFKQTVTKNEDWGTYEETLEIGLFEALKLIKEQL